MLLIHRLRTGKDGHCCIGVEQPRLGDEEAVWGFATDHERLNMEQTMRFGDRFLSGGGEDEQNSRTDDDEGDDHDVKGITTDLFANSALSTANLGE